jgi:hypothetical protein
VWHGHSANQIISSNHLVVFPLLGFRFSHSYQINHRLLLAVSVSPLTSFNSFQFNPLLHSCATAIQRLFDSYSLKTIINGTLMVLSNGSQWPVTESWYVVPSHASDIQINQSINGNASYSLTNLSWVLVGSLLAVATALHDSGLYTGYGKIKMWALYR